MVPSGAKKVQRRIAPSIRKRTDRKNRPWLLDLPAELSETGKRQRLHFAKKLEAERELEKRLRDKAAYGDQSDPIHPGLSAEAKEAAELLKPWNATLLQAVQAYVSTRERDAASETVSKAWAEYEKLKETRAPSHRENLAQFGRKLPEWFKAMAVSAVTPDDVRRVLGNATTGASRFNKCRGFLNNFFKECIKDEWCDANPVERVRKKDKDTIAEVPVLSVEELQDVFGACQDYRTSGDYPRNSKEARRELLDCRDCALSFAILAFAGVRPIELTRLTWEDVSIPLRNIRIGARNSKTRTLRNVRIEGNLLAWMEAVPKAKRNGPLVPSDWTRKRAKVMREAELPVDNRQAQQRLQDVFRHSYGSYHLATFSDLEALQANMGHSHATTYFNHYHNARLKAEALPWWQIGPNGVEIELVGVAA